jgi:Big-like domain-containing protein
MESNRRPQTTAVSRLMRWAAPPLIAALMPAMLVQAQTPVPPPVLPACSVPPSPDTDTWPVARPDTIGVSTGAPIQFTGAALVANDVGVGPLTVVSPIDSTPHKGGTVTGSDPFTYTPPAAFAGTDSFTYEVSDSLGRRAVGLVKVTVAGDAIAPTVAITAPPAGTVSGTVSIVATAFDAVGVAGVRFFVDGTPLGVEDTAAPYQVSWDTTLVADGAHALTATARDAAGNVGTAAPVSANVSNVVTPPPPPPPPSGIAVQATVRRDGAGAITTPAFSTTVPGQVLIALAASDGPTSGTNNQFLTISGGGLSWTRVQRAAVQRGVAEIWTATAPSILSNVTVTSTQSVTSVLGSAPNQSLVVVAFTGATGVGASRIVSSRRPRRR